MLENYYYYNSYSIKYLDLNLLLKCCPNDVYLHISLPARVPNLTTNTCESHYFVFLRLRGLTMCAKIKTYITNSIGPRIITTLIHPWAIWVHELA